MGCSLPKSIVNLLSVLCNLHVKLYSPFENRLSIVKLDFLDSQMNKQQTECHQTLKYGFLVGVYHSNPQKFDVNTLWYWYFRFLKIMYVIPVPVSSGKTVKLWFYLCLAKYFKESGTVVSLRNI